MVLNLDDLLNTFHLWAKIMNVSIVNNLQRNSEALGQTLSDTLNFHLHTVHHFSSPCNFLSAASLHIFLTCYFFFVTCQLLIQVTATVS